MWNGDSETATTICPRSYIIRPFTNIVYNRCKYTKYADNFETNIFILYNIYIYLSQ